MRWLLIALWAASTQAHGDWLSMCEGISAPPLRQDNSALTYYLQPDERAITLQLTEQPSGNQCQQRELNIRAQDVAWAGFSTKLTADTVSIGLQGRIKDQRFHVSEIILPETAAETPAETPAETSAKPPFLGRLIRTNPMTRSAWFWSPDLWLEQPARIFDVTSKFSINRIYISVPVSNGAVNHSERLYHFIQRAHVQGLQVWAVLGDPQAVMNEGSFQFLSISAAYGAFNESAPPTAKMDGLQLDIEVYLLPG